MRCGLLSFLAPEPQVHQHHQQQGNTATGDHGGDTETAKGCIAELHIHLPAEGGFHILLAAGADLTALVDDSRHTVIGAANHIATILQGAHLRHLQVLQGADRLAEV